MAGYRNNKKFAEAVLPSCLLDESIQWIQNNLLPEDVFTDEQLFDWAINNNYIYQPVSKGD